jgi:hypothetical protein
VPADKNTLLKFELVTNEGQVECDTTGQPSQVIEAARRVGMFRTKDLLPDPKRFLKERLGFGALAHFSVQRGQVIEAQGRVGIFWATHAPCYFTGLLRQRNSLLRPAMSLIGTDDRPLRRNVGLENIGINQTRFCQWRGSRLL